MDVLALVFSTCSSLERVNLDVAKLQSPNLLMLSSKTYLHEHFLVGLLKERKQLEPLKFRSLQTHLLAMPIK